MSDSNTRSRRISSAALVLLGLIGTCGIVSGCKASAEIFVPERRDPVTGEIQIPKEASYVAGGRGQLTWKVPHNGRIYVRDMTAEKALFSTEVRRGQTFTIVPSEDRASLDGEDVPAADMQTRNEHRIYFLANPS
jgi:hypothetical protein